MLWENVASRDHLEIIALSMDGIDFKKNKDKHPTLPRDNSVCSHKMNHKAVKYEVTLAVQHTKCVYIASAFKGDTHGLDMMRLGGLKENSYI
jgi:hypothetical protein